MHKIYVPDYRPCHMKKSKKKKFLTSGLMGIALCKIVKWSNVMFKQELSLNCNVFVLIIEYRSFGNSNVYSHIHSIYFAWWLLFHVKCKASFWVSLNFKLSFFCQTYPQEVIKSWVTRDQEQQRGWYNLHLGKRPNPALTDAPALWFWRETCIFFFSVSR